MVQDQQKKREEELSQLNSNLSQLNSNIESLEADMKKFSLGMRAVGVRDFGCFTHFII